jgi:hypothetical protein
VDRRAANGQAAARLGEVDDRPRISPTLNNMTAGRDGLFASSTTLRQCQFGDWYVLRQ